MFFDSELCSQVSRKDSSPKALLKDALQRSYLVITMSCIYGYLEKFSDVINILCQFLGCRKQLRDVFNTTVLRETTTQIIKIFMSTASPHHWLDYVMPGDNQSSITDTLSTDDDAVAPNFNKFDQLMMETRAVLLRYENYKSSHYTEMDNLIS